MVAEYHRRARRGERAPPFHRAVAARRSSAQEPPEAIANDPTHVYAVDARGQKSAIRGRVFSVELAPGAELTIDLAPPVPWANHISVQGSDHPLGVELGAANVIHIAPVRTARMEWLEEHGLQWQPQVLTWRGAPANATLKLTKPRLGSSRCPRPDQSSCQRGSPSTSQAKLRSSSACIALP
jgi:hypothetical protein